MSKELDFTAAWNDGMALLKAHREAAIAIAGVFIFLPQLIFTYFYPQPAFEGSDINTMIEQLKVYQDKTFVWSLLTLVLSLFGVLAINFLSINRAEPAAGEAIILGTKHYLTMLAAIILLGIATAVGSIFLIVPGIYVFIKFSQVTAVIAAENQINPIEVMSRSWQITKGNSLRIFAFILIVEIVSVIAVLIFNMALGGGARLILPDSAGLFAVAFVTAFSGTVSTLIIIFVDMGIYRQLTASD